MSTCFVQYETTVLLNRAANKQGLLMIGVVCWQVFKIRNNGIQCDIGIVIYDDAKGAIFIVFANVGYRLVEV